MSEFDFEKEFNNQQQIVMIMRRVQLGVGCLAMLFIISSIIKRRLHLYNTTKLFMCCCICYFIGMFVVLLYFQSMSNGNKFVYTDEQYKDQKLYILKVLNQIKNNPGIYFACGLESFLNLWLYDLGYFFGLLISYNVLCVICDDYRHFIKKVFKDIKVRMFLAFIFLVYSVPFIFMYTTSNYQQSFWYAYGPMGIKYQVTFQDTTESAQLLLFEGFRHNTSQPIYNLLLLINIYICPLIMLIIHFKILFENRKGLQKFIRDQYLNSKQRFLIQSGRLGIILFTIQAFHFIKLVFSFLPFIKDKFYFLLVANFIFDMYPLLLLSFYLRYTREKISNEHAQTIISSQQ